MHVPLCASMGMCMLMPQITITVCDAITTMISSGKENEGNQLVGKDPCHLMLSDDFGREAFCMGRIGLIIRNLQSAVFRGGWMVRLMTSPEAIWNRLGRWFFEICHRYQTSIAQR